MNIQVLHPNPTQVASERLRPAPEVSDAAAHAVTGPDEAPGVTAAASPGGAGESGLQGERRDQYVFGEKGETAGLYRMTKDEDGNPVVRFDDPKAAEKERAARDKEAEAEAKEKKAEEEEARTRTTIDTGRVDREIEELKDQVEDLEQRLNYGGSLVDAEKVERELTFAKIELHLKDNDTYRRANAQVTRG